MRKALEQDGLANNTIIFMFGDHGQSHVRGKQWCYDSGLHIPLIVYVPPGISKPAYLKTVRAKLNRTLKGKRSH